MVDNFKEAADMFKFASEKMSGLDKRMEQVLKMLPKEPPVKVKINGKEVMASTLKDGRVLLEFENSEAAKNYLTVIEKKMSFWDKIKYCILQ